MDRRGLLGGAVWAAWVLVACSGGGGSDGGSGGGGGGGAGGGGGSSGSTTVTLSGARSSTLTDTGPFANYTPAVDRSEVGKIVGNSAEETSFDFRFPGEPAVRTYVGDTDAGITCNIYDTLDGGLDGWMADRGTGIGDPGDCSLTLSAVTLAQDVGSQKRYDVHGSVTAHLPARSGNASGTINFSASF